MNPRSRIRLRLINRCFRSPRRRTPRPPNKLVDMQRIDRRYSNLLLLAHRFSRNGRVHRPPFLMSCLLLKRSHPVCHPAAAGHRSSRHHPGHRLRSHRIRRSIPATPRPPQAFAFLKGCFILNSAHHIVALAMYFALVPKEARSRDSSSPVGCDAGAPVVAGAGG